MYNSSMNAENPSIVSQIMTITSNTVLSTYIGRVDFSLLNILQFYAN